MDQTLSLSAPPRPGWLDRLRERFIIRALSGLGPLEVVAVPLPGTATTLEIRRPDQAEGGGCGLPFWAEIWPSGVVLAGVIARDPARFRGRTVLELGPGVGVTAVAALQAGAELTVADTAAGALLLSSLNARHQTGRAPRTLNVNWRYPGQALEKAAGDGFGVVLAADVLYETQDIKPLVRLVERIVAPDGELWLAEPGREPAQQVIERLLERGWADDAEDCACPWPDPHEQVADVVTVHRLSRR